MPTPLEQLIRQAAGRLPRPSGTATDRARRAALAALDGRSDRSGSGGRVSLLVAAALLLAAGLTAGFFLAPTGRSARGTAVLPAGPGFIPANGWNTITAARPRVASAIAANVELLDTPLAGTLPRRTLERLPPSGIVMVAALRPSDELAVRAARPGLPLRLADATVTFAHGLTRYSVRGASAGYDVEVDVFFARRPSAELRAEAQAELARLAVPPITITARPLILAGPISPQYEPLTLSGSIASRERGERITIQANECTFPGWRDVLSTETDASGAWHVTAGALTKTSFRAKWKTAVSAAVIVLTRPGVDLAPLGRTRWNVGVLAQRSFLDRKVRLQRYDKRSRKWTTLRLVRLTDKYPTAGSGVWTRGSVRVRVARGTQLRAMVPRRIVRPCYLAGYSLIVTVQ